MTVRLLGETSFSHFTTNNHAKIFVEQTRDHDIGGSSRLFTPEQMKGHCRGQHEASQMMQLRSRRIVPGRDAECLRRQSWSGPRRYEIPRRYRSVLSRVPTEKACLEEVERQGLQYAGLWTSAEIRTMERMANTHETGHYEALNQVVKLATGGRQGHVD